MQGTEVADVSAQSHSIHTNENNFRTFDVHERACIVRRHRRIYWTCVMRGVCVCERTIAVMKPDDIVIGICIGGCPPSPRITLDLEDAPRSSLWF